MYKPGRFSEKLRRGTPIIGTHVRSVDCTFTELLCEIGYEAIFMDMEHSMLTKETILPLILAAQGTDSLAVVRVPWNDLTQSKPILELAPDAVIFPWICSAEDARKAVSLCTYPPRGIRGYGPARGNHYGTEPVSAYLSHAANDIFKIMQIEHVNGVQALGEILQIDGVDGIMIGPFDLSGSIGRLGEVNCSENQALIRQIFDTCRAAGKPVGISAGSNSQEIRRYLDWGASFVFICFEYDWIREMGGATLRQTKAYLEEGGKALD